MTSLTTGNLNMEVLLSLYCDLYAVESFLLALTLTLLLFLVSFGWLVYSTESQDSGYLYFCFRWLLIRFKRELSFTDVLRLWEVSSLLHNVTGQPRCLTRDWLRFRRGVSSGGGVRLTACASSAGDVDGPPLSELPPAGLLCHPGLREAEDHGGELRLQRDPEGETMLLVQDQHSSPGRWLLLASRCSTLVT